MFGIVVCEIVSQREPHTNIDPKQIVILIRWVCLFVSILFLFIFHLTNFSFWFFHFWIQRQRIDTRNSFKLPSETCWIDANVLEERTSTTSCILFLFCFLFCHFKTQINLTTWFVSSLIEMLIGFWNNLWNVGIVSFSKSETPENVLKNCPWK
jgi:hypothetical protein